MQPSGRKRSGTKICATECCSCFDRHLYKVGQEKRGGCLLATPAHQVLLRNQLQGRVKGAAWEGCCSPVVLTRLLWPPTALCCRTEMSETAPALVDPTVLWEGKSNVHEVIREQPERNVRTARQARQTPAGENAVTCDPSRGFMGFELDGRALLE